MGDGSALDFLLICCAVISIIIANTSSRIWINKIDKMEQAVYLMAYEVSSLGLVWAVGIPDFKASYEDY